MRDPQGHRLFGILVTFRRQQQLAEMLSSLTAQSQGLDQLIVVDNGGFTTEVEEIIRRHYRAPCQYLPTSENLGPAGGISLGMQTVWKLAEGEDWVVLLDDDDPPPGLSVFGQLRRFADEMILQDRRTAGVGLVGARLNSKRGQLIRVPDVELSAAVPVDYIGGNAFPFYRVGITRRVGPFLSQLFFGFEELEYGLRLQRAGYSLYAHGELWRQERKRLGRMGLRVRPNLAVSGGTWRDYYSLRNMIFLLRMYGHTGAALETSFLVGLLKPVANLPFRPHASLDQLRLNWKACMHGWRGQLGRTINPESPSYPGVVVTTR